METNSARPGLDGAVLDPELLAIFLPENRPDPYPVYERLRANGPLRPSPTGVWIAAGHEAAAAILRDERFGSDMRKASGYGFLDQPESRELMDRRAKVMLFSDPPDHTRLRSLVNRAFTARVVERLRDRVRAIATDLIDAVRARGEMDLIADLAYPLPVTVIAEMLGVPPGDHERFAGWSRALARNLDPVAPPEVLEAAYAAGEAFDEYFLELIAERRARPRDDLLTSLIQAEDQGHHLSEDELLSMCALLLIAGHETTVNLIGNGTLALLRHPGELARLRDDPALTPGAVEELLRYDSPVQLTGRTALADVDVAGTKLGTGDLVLVLVGGANRDPARFAEPETLRVDREDARHHLAFSAGAHFCLGAQLARVEGAIALEILLRLDDLRLATDEPPWKQNLVLRGLESLPLAFRAA